MSENRPFRLFTSAARDPRMPYTAKPVLEFTGCHCPLPVQPNAPSIGRGVGNIDVHDAGSLPNVAATKLPSAGTRGHGSTSCVDDWEGNPRFPGPARHWQFPLLRRASQAEPPVQSSRPRLTLAIVRPVASSPCRHRQRQRTVQRQDLCCLARLRSGRSEILLISSSDKGKTWSKPIV